MHRPDRDGQSALSNEHPAPSPEQQEVNHLTSQQLNIFHLVTL